MLLDTRLDYLIVSADWFETTKTFRVLASRHGNAVVETYSGTTPQLWKILPSGKIKNAGTEETYLSYDPDRVVRLHTATTPTTEWFVQDVGDFHAKTRLIPKTDTSVCVRCPYPSHFVECEEPGIGNASSWYIVDAKKFRVHLDSGGDLDVRMM
jgi:hypothetical protein